MKIRLLIFNDYIFINKLFRQVLYFVVSATVSFSFLSNWSLLDGAPRNSLSAMLTGDAHRPFVYRQLVPVLVNRIEAALPRAISELLANNVAPRMHRQFVEPLVKRFEANIPNLRERVKEDWSQATYRVKYVITAIILLTSLCATLNVLVYVALEVKASNSASQFGPIAYALLLPLTFLNGGYFYDFTEQFFVSLLLFATLSGNWFMWVVAAILGEINKETMLMVPLFLIPLVANKMGFRRALLLVIVTMFICFLIYMAVKYRFELNSGAPIEYHLATNIAFWSDPANYLRLADMYAIGVPLPRISFLLVLICIIIYGLRSPWPVLLSTSISLLVLIPMLITLGSCDEFRNLSLSFPLLFLATVISRLQAKKSAPD